jgi:hypothetical protein
MAKPPQIQPVTAKDLFLNVMVYGINGIGKTPFLGTSPNLLVLESPGGRGETTTLASMGSEADVWEVNSRTQMWEAYEYVRHEGVKEYEWVWIDSGTGYETVYMEEELDVMVSNRKNKGQNFDRVPDKREYLLVQTEMKKVAAEFASLPINFGMTATVMMQAWNDVDEDGDDRETVMMMPQIQGSNGGVAMKICGEFNVIGYLDRLEVDGIDGETAKYVPALLLDDPRKRHVARDRTLSIPTTAGGWLLNPTVPKIQAAIQKRRAATKVAKPVGKAAAKAAPRKAARTTKVAGKKTARVQRS